MTIIIIFFKSYSYFILLDLLTQATESFRYLSFTSSDMVVCNVLKSGIFPAVIFILCHLNLEVAFPAEASEGDFLKNALRRGK